MTKIAQRSFAGGEISPTLAARVDQVKYALGLATCKNLMVLREGGAANRPGYLFCAETKDSTQASRLAAFIFNDDQTYALEMGDEYMRFYRNGALITETGKVVSGVSQAAQGVVTATAHGFENGDEVYLSGIVGMTELNGRNLRVSDKTADTFKIKDLAGNYVNTSGYGAYVSGGTAARIYEIETPYAAEDVNALELQYIQSADVVIFTHQGYAPQKLSRAGDTNWTMEDITFEPGIAAPANLTSDSPGAGYDYVVTAVADESREESLPSAVENATTQTSTLTWDAVSGAVEYNVYKSLNGVYGFIGTAVGTSFQDSSIEPDTTQTPPIERNPFETDFPATAAFYQQRLGFANTPLNPATCFFSRTSNIYNFTTRSPLQDDDAATFTLVGRRVNATRWMLDVGGKLLVGTAAGVWSIEGGTSGTLTPTEPNPRQQVYGGTSPLAPIAIQGTALHIQERGSIVRDLSLPTLSSPLDSKDRTIFSSHLFKRHTIVDWTYQEVPNSIVWAVRDDGVLLGLTYVREHEVWAWHRHETDGLVESVCAIPEGDEDSLYLIVRRTIDGREVRYVERMATREIGDIVDYVGMDSALSYDGRNTNGAKTMTLSGGSTWTHPELLTLTCSASEFTSADVGNEIQLTGPDGDLVLCEIDAYTSGTVVQVRPDRDVPSNMRNAALSGWAHAVRTVGNLWHLEGEQVSIFADGLVVGNPNDEDDTAFTVEDGEVELDAPYARIHVGLPYISDLGTLDIDQVQGETTAGKKMNVGEVTIYFESTRGVLVGPNEDNLVEMKIRERENYDQPVDLVTGKRTILIKPEWNSNGRILIRQTDPLPMTILAIMPGGFIPVGR